MLLAAEVEIARELQSTPEGAGQLLVANNGCAACHSVNGAAGIGPTWFNLYEHEVELSDGSVVIADDAYLTESIKAPQAKIVAEFETQLMPTYGFTDEEVANIVAYIKTLR